MTWMVLAVDDEPTVREHSCGPLVAQRVLAYAF
jgi:hypothetical protein